MADAARSIDPIAAETRALTLRVLRHQNRAHAEEPVMLARDLARAGRWLDARLVCTTALQEDPSDVDLLLASAEVARELGETLDARTLLVRAAHLAPDWEEPMFRLARTLFQEGDIGRAWAAVERALLMAPHDPRIEALHADVEQAHRLTLRMHRFLRDESNDDGAMLANALVAEGRSEDALEVLAHALRQEPEDADALFVRGNILRAQGHMDLAREALRRVTQVASGWADGWDAMADVLEDLGELAHAERLRAHAATIEVDPLMLIDMAVIAGSPGSLEVAAYPEMELGIELDRAVAAGVAAMTEIRRADPTGPFQLARTDEIPPPPLEDEEVIPVSPLVAKEETSSASDERAPVSLRVAKDESSPANERIPVSSLVAKAAESQLDGAVPRSENASDACEAGEGGELAVHDEARPSAEFATARARPSVEIVFPIEVWGPKGHPARMNGSPAEVLAHDAKERAQERASRAEIIPPGFETDEEAEAFPSIDIDLSDLVEPAQALARFEPKLQVRAEPIAKAPAPRAEAMLRDELLKHLMPSGWERAHVSSTLAEPAQPQVASRLVVIDGKVQLCSAESTLLGNGFEHADQEAGDTLIDTSFETTTFAGMEAPLGSLAGGFELRSPTVSAARIVSAPSETGAGSDKGDAAPDEAPDATAPFPLMTRAHARRASLRDAILATAGVRAEELEEAVSTTRAAALRGADETPAEAAASEELDEFIEEVVVRPRLRMRKKASTPYVPPPPSSVFPRAMGRMPSSSSADDAVRSD